MADKENQELALSGRSELFELHPPDCVISAPRMSSIAARGRDGPGGGQG